MNSAYRDGYAAFRSGIGKEECPYGRLGSVVGDSPKMREKTPLCLRHWWLAGWHDADIDRQLAMRGAA